MKEINRNLIVFISGVPSAGKTTISYELLKHMNLFRIVQETDIIREILRGYNTYLTQHTHTDFLNLSEPAPHTELLSYSRAKEQCAIMKNSIEEIVKRQVRKCIPTIICGVHIIPELLFRNISNDNSNIKFINLYFDCEDDLYTHLSKRDQNKYGKKSVPFLFKMNLELQNSILDLQSKYPESFISVNVGKLSIKETVNAIVDFLQ